MAGRAHLHRCVQPPNPAGAID